MRRSALQSLRNGSSLHRWLAAAVVAWLALDAPARAADPPVTLRFGTHEPRTAFVYSRIWKLWEELVVKESDGALRIEDHVRTPETEDSTRNLAVVESGAVDIAFIVVPLFPERFADQDLFMQPGMLRNSVEASVAATRLAERGLLAGSDKTVPLAMMVAVPSLLHSTYPVAQPGDLAGRRFNTSAPLVAEVFAQLGATMSQTYVTARAAETLRRGEFDGVIADWVGSETFGTLDAARHHLDYPLGGVMLAFLMNRASYERLRGAVRQVLDRHKGVELATAFGRSFDEGVAAVLARMAADPAQRVFRPEGEQRAAWDAAFASPLARWRGGNERRGALARALDAELAAVRAGQ